jgi:FlaG/FlaF family flagellin (archaellin)
LRLNISYVLWFFKDKKALSPIASAIILIAITVAVTIGSASFNFMKTDEPQITGCMWTPNSSHTNITVSNFGSEAVSINSVQLDGTVVAERTFVSGDSTVLEYYADPPTTVMSNGYSGFETYYYYVLVAEVKQYLVDIAARKALFFNSSGLQKEEVNGETGPILGLMDIQATFHVSKIGNYWEAIQGDSQHVSFGGSECTGGVSGSDGGAVLNAAINAVSVAGGGRVTIGCGNLLADQITPKSHVDVCGEGIGTVLRQNANANTIFIYSGEKIVNFSMHDLTIDYNHQNQSSPKEGMWIGYASEYVHLYQLWIENCKKFGIHLASMDQPSNPPISCENAKVEDITFTDVVAENSDLCVVASHGGYIRNVRIIGLHRNAGVVAFESTAIQVSDCRVTIESQDGDIVGCIWLGSCKDSLCANNTVFGETTDGFLEAIGIRVNREHDNTNPRDSYKNLVTDNRVTTIKHGIMLEETSDDDVVSNILTDCTNGIVFPSYGNPAASNPKIVLNSLRNVTNPVREFVIPNGMKQYFNDGVSTSYFP